MKPCKPRRSPRQFGKLNIAPRPRYLGNARLRILPKGSAAAFEAPVTSYYFRSGSTGPDGVTGEIVYCGHNLDLKLPADLRGKIAFVDCSVPKGVATSEWFRFYEVPGKGTVPEHHEPTAWTQMLHVPRSLELFERAGAVGLILGWTQFSDDMIRGYHIPYNGGLQNMPALWVPKDVTARLHALPAGATAHFTLDATVTPDSPTDSLIALLPGASNETIVVTTHTDGHNLVQENGGFGLIGIAQHFAARL